MEKFYIKWNPVFGISKSEFKGGDVLNLKTMGKFFDFTEHSVPVFYI